MPNKEIFQENWNSGNFEAHNRKSESRSGLW